MTTIQPSPLLNPPWVRARARRHALVGRARLAARRAEIARAVADRVTFWDNPSAAYIWRIWAHTLDCQAIAAQRAATRATAAMAQIPRLPPLA